MLLALNETGWPLIFTSVTGARLLNVPNNVRAGMIRAGHSLLDATGSFTVETHDEYWHEMPQRVLDEITEARGNPNDTATR